MANTRTIANPFTKKVVKMHRNTASDRWVSSDSMHLTTEDTARSWPQQDGHRLGQANPPLQALPRRDKPQNRSEAPLTDAAIHDVSDLYGMPHTFTHSPSVRSWASFRDSTYGENESGKIADVQAKSRYPVSPLEEDFIAHSDEPISPSIQRQEDSHEANLRNGSVVTVFPHMTVEPSEHELGESESKPKGGWRSKDRPVADPPTRVASDTWRQGAAKGTDRSVADLFHAAKDIYHSGPKGEGQKLWKTYKHYQKERYMQAQVAQLVAEDTHDTSSQDSKYRQLPKVPSRPPQAASQNGSRADSQNATTKKSSSGLQKSREVPAVMSLDTNKPLPPIPRLDSAPKGRPIRTKATHWRSHPESAKVHQYEPKDKKSTHWWSSKAQIGKFKDRPSDLKSKISRPQLLSHDPPSNLIFNHGTTSEPNPMVTNVDIKARPVLHRAAESRTLDKGKQKAKLETVIPPKDSSAGHGKMSRFHNVFLGRSRHDSDVSFACMGLPEDGQVYIEDPGSSRQLEHELHLTRKYDDMLPQPLFSGNRGGGGKVENRNSEFYDAYHDVLREY